MFKILDEGKNFSKSFFLVPHLIYQDDLNWVCVPDIAIKNIFNREGNPAIKSGDYNLWILYENGEPVGRIIAFWTESKSKNKRPYSGGISFFECIDSQEAANLLFDSAVEWLKAAGMQAVDGVIVPGENYNHWGILIDGFSKQGFGMPYNLPYYKQLFENYGFKVYFEQNSYHVDLSKEFPERHVKFAKHIVEKGDFSFGHAGKKMNQKDVRNTTIVFNDVWSAFHANHQFVEEEYFEKIVKELKPVSNPKFIWFAYKDDYPIGMAIAFPDLNLIFDKFKGKFHLLNKLKMVHKIKNVNRARLLVFGVNPKYHSSGVAGALFWKMTEAMKEEGIEELEMSWVGDYNPKVNRIYKHLGNSTHAKTHVTMRYIIDSDIIFERFTN